LRPAAAGRLEVCNERSHAARGVTKEDPMWRGIGAVVAVMALILVVVWFL